MSASLCRCSRSTRQTETKNDEKADHANVHFPPPLIHLIAVMAAIGVAAFLPLSLPRSGLLVGLGAGLLTLSLWIVGSAFRQFARSDNPVPPNRPINDLMDGGPFRFTRNPLYLALALLQAGVGLISGNGWILVTLLPALAVVRYYVIAREEAYLTRRFGQAYLDYQARVRRWF